MEDKSWIAAVSLVGGREAPWFPLHRGWKMGKPSLAPLQTQVLSFFEYEINAAV